MNVRYLVELSESERLRLQTMVNQGTERVRRLKRAQVLLVTERGQSEAVIARTLSVGTSTVYRTKRRFVEEGLENALSELPRARSTSRITSRKEVPSRTLC